MLRQHLGDRRRQRRLAMVNVTNRTNVHVRLTALEFLLRHIPLTSHLVIRHGRNQLRHPLTDDGAALRNLERGTGFEPATITLEE